METTTITATYNRAIYNNTDTNFLIGSFSPQKRQSGIPMQFAAKGGLVNPQVGMDYKLTGRWDFDERYGKQFAFDVYETIKPTDANGIYRYLVRVAKWVGPSIAATLVDIYEDKTLDVLKSDPEIVAAEIPGISLKRATTIQNTLQRNEAIETILVDLLEILSVPGMLRALPMRLINKHKGMAADLVRENPYMLTEFPGVGFSLADLVAIEKLKIKPDSEFRIRAAINHSIKECLKETGSTWAYLEEIINSTRLLISQSIEKITPVAEEMIAKKEIAENSGRVTLLNIDGDESLIANKILVMVEEDGRGVKCH